MNSTTNKTHDSFRRYFNIFLSLQPIFKQLSYKKFTVRFIFNSLSVGTKQFLYYTKGNRRSFHYTLKNQIASCINKCDYIDFYILLYLTQTRKCVFIVKKFYLKGI